MHFFTAHFIFYRPFFRVGKQQYIYIYITIYRRIYQQYIDISKYCSLSERLLILDDLEQLSRGMLSAWHFFLHQLYLPILLPTNT